MSVSLSRPVQEYVAAVNRHDARGFLELFTPDAHVDDAGRAFHGREAIRQWSQHDVFDALVTFEPLGAHEREGHAVLTTKVDGNFDRTGLPDPVLIDHWLEFEGGKIRSLTCRLTGASQAG